MNLTRVDANYGSYVVRPLVEFLEESCRTRLTVFLVHPLHLKQKLARQNDIVVEFIEM